MIPFDAESYFRLVASYNQAFLPVHLAACILGLVAIACVLGPRPGSGRFAAAILAAFWLWTGVIFHAMEFAVLNWAAPAFGAIFAVQGLLLLWTGTLRGRLHPRMRRDIYGAAGALLVLVAVAGYPLFDLLAGAGWPAVRLFPVAPAPLAVFTLGLLLLGRPQPLLHLMAIPLLWTVLHGAAAWEMALPAELVAPLMGAAAFGLTFGRRARRDGGVG